MWKAEVNCPTTDQFGSSDLPAGSRRRRSPAGFLWIRTSNQIKPMGKVEFDFFFLSNKAAGYFLLVGSPVGTP
jgi:hypothetical protein